MLVEGCLCDIDGVLEVVVSLLRVDYVKPVQCEEGLELCHPRNGLAAAGKQNGNEGARAIPTDRMHPRQFS